MIQSSFVENRSVSLCVLSDDEIWEIKQAAFDVLEKTGCNVLHEGARKLLKQAGARVKDERVWTPQYIVEECIRTAPKGFTIYDREGKRALEVKGRKSYYGTSTASPNTRDAFSNEVRETRVSDIALGAQVADALPNIDWVMPMGSSQDVPALAADVYEFEAVVTNTSKPIVFIGYSPQGVEQVYEMAAEVAGGLENLQQRPFLLAYPEPISPLVVPAEVVERMFIAADLGMPQIPGPSVQPGATGPMTLAGTVAQIIRGIKVNAGTLARDVIEDVGPGGHFLQQDHTYQHFRQELWMPELLTRAPYDNWLEAGAKNLEQRVHDRVREIVEPRDAAPAR